MIAKTVRTNYSISYHRRFSNFKQEDDDDKNTLSLMDFQIILVISSPASQIMMKKINYYNSKAKLQKKISYMPSSAS